MFPTTCVLPKKFNLKSEVFQQRSISWLRYTSEQCLEAKFESYAFHHSVLIVTGVLTIKLLTVYMNSMGVFLELVRRYVHFNGPPFLHVFKLDHDAGFYAQRKLMVQHASDTWQQRISLAQPRIRDKLSFAFDSPSLFSMRAPKNPTAPFRATQILQKQ